jgi:hypothetical protein
MHLDYGCSLDWVACGGMSCLERLQVSGFGFWPIFQNDHQKQLPVPALML